MIKLSQYKELVSAEKEIHKFLRELDDDRGRSYPEVQTDLDKAFDNFKALADKYLEND